MRANYSTPPTHGAQIVAMVLGNAELRALWESELSGMRERIREMRKTLVEKLTESAPGADFTFVLTQRGMFSYTGLTPAQVARLRNEFSIYAIDTGRICVAALNSRNVGHTAKAIGGGDQVLSRSSDRSQRWPAEAMRALTCPPIVI